MTIAAPQNLRFREIISFLDIPKRCCDLYTAGSRRDLTLFIEEDAAKTQHANYEYFYDLSGVWFVWRVAP